MPRQTIMRPVRRAPATVGPADWRMAAACREVEDPDVFFPLDESTDTAAAKKVCAGCPVSEDCLNWAVGSGQDYGIWGGLTPAERRELTRRGRRHLVGVGS